MYKHILIPTDGTATADKAVDAGIDYARETGARVTFFIAMPEYELPSTSAVMAHQPVISLAEHEQHSAEKANAILGKALARARTCGVVCAGDHALSNKPYEAIIAAVKRHECDAIFMSSHGRKGLAKLWYGSETVDVLTHSDIPTLVVR
jgi:nucleotide-binding universal stress UspA family protein